MHETLLCCQVDNFFMHFRNSYPSSFWFCWHTYSFLPILWNDQSQRLCSVFQFWKTKLLWKKNRKVFKICIVLKFGQGTNKKWESQSLWLVIPRILLSDLPEEKNVHHYEKVTKLITILRNEHSSSLLKTMQDLAIKTLKKWSHPGRKRKLPSPQCS